MRIKKSFARNAKRRNLGIRATRERQANLQRVARARGTSVQAMFDEFVDQLCSEGREADGPHTNHSDVLPDSKWRNLFLKALPAVAAIKRAADLKLVWVNEEYVAMTGEASQSLVGRSVGEIWAARESADLIERHDREALNQERATVEIEEVRDRWGRPLRRLRIRFPIHDGSGEVKYLGAVGFECEQILSRLGDFSRPITVPAGHK